MNPKTRADETTLAVMANDIGYIKADLAEIKEKLEGDYVRTSDFEPIKKIVYGMVGLILASVLTAIVSLVLKR